MERIRVRACGRGIAKAAVSGLLFFAIGCTDDPSRVAGPTDGGVRASVSSAADGIGIAAFPELIGDIPEARGDLAQFAPDLPDAELIEAVRAQGGIAHIGFKPASAPRSNQTGIFPAMTRAAALEAREQVQALGARLVLTYRGMASVVVEIPPELAPVIRRLPIVDYVEPTGQAYMGQATPPQDTSWGAKRINMPWVWASPTYGWVRGQYAHLTILDTGSDQIHRTSSSGDGPAYNLGECHYISPDFSNCNDDYGHGAHVSGIASAWNNAYGYIGVAHEPQTTATVKVCNASGCEFKALAAGLDWSATNGRIRQVVNMSIQTCLNNRDVYQAVVRSAAAGNLLVAIAGNTNFGACAGVLYPGKYPEVIAVSGTTEQDGFHSGSRYGPEVELSAPHCAPSMWLNGQYTVACGTSAAAPLVSGVGALVWTLFPQYSAADVRQRLRSRSVDLGAAGHDWYFGYGRVDAALAFTNPVSPPMAPSLTGPSHVKPNATCQWIADAGTAPVQPVTYSWAVNGQLQPETSQHFLYSGASSFVITMTVTDAEQRVWPTDLSVTVDFSAPICPDPV